MHIYTRCSGEEWRALSWMGRVLQGQKPCTKALCGLLDSSGTALSEGQVGGGRVQEGSSQGGTGGAESARETERTKMKPEKEKRENWK